jgi:hypothetical protein
MVNCIVPVFRLRQVEAPFAWPLVDKASEILFDAVIVDFHLAIDLWVIREAELQFSAWHLKELLLKVAYKNWIKDTNDGFGHAI